MMKSDSIWEAVIRVRAINIRDQSGPGATFCQFVAAERNKEKGEALRCRHHSTHRRPSLVTAVFPSANGFRCRISFDFPNHREVCVSFPFCG